MAKLLATAQCVRRSRGAGDAVFGALTAGRGLGSISLRELATQPQAGTGPKAASNQLPLRTGRQRLCVLGSGWAAARLLHDIDISLWDLTVRGEHQGMGVRGGM
jgi:NADH:ubiquinone reductase (non-electrogenic)